MLFYTHLVWSLAADRVFRPALVAFAGGLAARAVRRLLTLVTCGGSIRRRCFGSCNCGQCVIFAMLTLGLFSRMASVLDYRGDGKRAASGALFGLDDINAMLAMYLAIGPCGDAYSLDRLCGRARKDHGRRPVDSIARSEPAPSG